LYVYDVNRTFVVETIQDPGESSRLPKTLPYYYLEDRCLLTAATQQAPQAIMTRSLSGPAAVPDKPKTASHVKDAGNAGPFPSL
jgi:hypothetical protein